MTTQDVVDEHYQYAKEDIEEFRNKHSLMMWGNDTIKQDYMTPPPDITAISSSELGKYLWAVSQYEAYLYGVISTTEQAYESAKKEYYRHLGEAQEALREAGQKMTTEEKSIYLNQQKELRPYYIIKRQIKTELTILNNNLQSAEVLKNAYSREISRRDNEFQSERRLNNI